MLVDIAADKDINRRVAMFVWHFVCVGLMISVVCKKVYWWRVQIKTIHVLLLKIEKA